jgi:hypothetical protein
MKRLETDHSPANNEWKQFKLRRLRPTGGLLAAMLSLAKRGEWEWLHEIAFRIWLDSVRSFGCVLA